MSKRKTLFVNGSSKGDAIDTKPELTKWKKELKKVNDRKE
jgi:hypothetical protein